MTPSDMLSVVRDQLYEQDQDFWSDNEIYRYMSLAQSDISRSLLINKAKTTTTSTANDPLVDYPTNLMYLLGVIYDYTPLIKITQKQYDEMYKGASPAATKPEYYIDESSALELVPAPNSTGKSIRMDYIADPASINSTSTAFSIGPLYHEAILNYTMWKALDKDSDSSRIGEYYDAYQKSILQLRQDQSVFDYVDAPPFITVVED